MPNNQYISVSELNAYIKTYLENNYFLQEVYVRGEISNFKAQTSGSLYFAIKDENAAVNVIMFPMYSRNLKVKLKDGDLVLIKGKINVYEQRGTYSLIASEIIFDSIGMLYIQFEQLKEKLASEGYFAEEHKKIIPSYPTRIGLITASTGAAIQDMHRTIKSRWPIANIYVFPCLVQGENAKYDIVKKIQEADNYNLDVIICGRGGGSIEDLWPFNEEIVAKAIYDCNTPIISAVGHEIDTTIADYVADVRALTPTDGAVKATPNIQEVLNDIEKYKKQAIVSMNNYLNILNKDVNNYKNAYVLQNPLKIYEKYRYLVDELEGRLKEIIQKMTHSSKLEIIDNVHRIDLAIQQNIKVNKESYLMAVSKLDGLSPLKVLNRGYALVTSNEKVIYKIDDVKENEMINLALSDGNIKAKVINKEPSNGRK